MGWRSFGLPVLVAAAVATFAAGCQSSGEIRVLTYNVHGLPDIITGDDTEARMLAISPRLNEFDLAAIQENFFYSAALSGDVEGRFAYHFTERKPGTIAPGGLSVYSVLPAGEIGGDPWEACNGYLDAANDCLASKGFEFLRIVVPFTPISFDVYDLHMDAGNSAADDTARAAQAEQLLSAIDAQSAGQAVMVLGDFNLSIDDPEDVPILFCPDMFLGDHLRRVTGRANMHIWAGECHVHAGIRPEDLVERLAEHPTAEFLIHPECACTSSFVWGVGKGLIPAAHTHVLSTEGMLRFAEASPADTFIVATETGMLHRLRTARPEKVFLPADRAAECKYMKMITLPKLRDCLRDLAPEVLIAPEIADRARASIERMLAVSPLGAAPVIPGE